MLSSYQNALISSLMDKRTGIVAIPDAIPGGGIGKSYVVDDPANIRSRFAAFDPAKRGKADLLGNADPALLGLMAGGGLLGVGAYGLLGESGR